MVVWRRRILIFAVFVLVALALVYGFFPRAVPVETAKAQRGKLVVAVEEEGKTRVIDRYAVSAPVAGYLRRITLEVGDEVFKGRTIAELEPQRSKVLDPRSRAEAEAKVAAAEASLKEAKERARAARADSEYASSELKRTKELYSGGYATKDRLEEDETKAERNSAALRSAEFSVEVAGYELEAARTALRQFTGGSNVLIKVASPVSGRVLKIHRKSEGSVNEGEPVIEVGDPRSLEVTAELLSSDAVKVAPGTKVLIDRWGGEAPLEGKVRVVEPSGFTKVSALGVEEQRVIVVSDFTSPAPLWERLGDSYRVETHFIIWEGDNVLKVPSSALFRHGEGWAVFTVKDSRAQRRPIKTGRQGGLETEILEGIKEGDPVITHPSDAINDGKKVKLR